MGFIDIVNRVDAICEKYEKYDIDKPRDLNNAGDDAFFCLHTAVKASYEQILKKSEKAAAKKNRATAEAIYDEIRRTKARLLRDELPKLQRLALKKVKGLSGEELEYRSNLVTALKEWIEAVPDGSTSTAEQAGDPTASASNAGIKFDSTKDEIFDSDYFLQIDETDNFKQEFEMRKMKQDQGLDDIAEGLDKLKILANNMNEELDRQVSPIDEIEDKVDKTSSILRSSSNRKNTNVQLKDTITKLRSSHNFCIDVILLCIILGIAAHVYNILK